MLFLKYVLSEKILFSQKRLVLKYKIRWILLNYLLRFCENKTIVSFHKRNKPTFLFIRFSS